MSFGGNNTFSGFGQQNQTTGGAFGSPFGANNNNNNTTPAFGAPTTGAFGQTANTSSPSNLFGAPSAGGFGSGGGFGSSNNNSTTGAFGARPAFGAATTTGGSLFGSTTATSGSTAFGGGGFGANTTSTSSPFGGGAGSSLFGGNNNNTLSGGTLVGNTGGSLFGGGNNTFGSTNNNATTGAFGATNNPGIGTNIGPAPGTQNPPFTALVEKEANTTGSNSFQNILFQDAYKNYSSEELRMVDYTAGRRYGNAASGFGGSTFGGANTFGNNNQAQTNTFGANTGTGLFGNTQPAAGGFGANNATANTGGAFGGLFGASKPAATGGLFGNTATQTAAQPAGTSFGGFGSTPANNTTTGGAFGATGTTNLFGQAAQQNKPNPFGAFGTQNNTATGGAFGTPTSTNTGFGANNNAQATNTGGGLFGNTTTPQNNATGGFGSSFGTQNAGGASLFGNNNQPKTGGLFGQTNTAQPAATGGLFGNLGGTTAASPFGGATQQPAGGLFGAKPAEGGTGLFGNTASQPQATSSPFGAFGTNNTAQQQPAQNSLFGGFGQNTQQGSSLFGNSTQAAGNNAFGTPNNQQQQGAFGMSTPQPARQSIFSLSQTPQQGQGLVAQIDDPSAFGASGLFANLGSTDVQNPGPLVTPLSGQKMKKQAALPLWKLHPGSASKFTTPSKRGYGFTYSTYGSPATPGSANSTPGQFQQSLLGGGSLSRALGKTISSSSLRKSFNAEDSILSPGAFSASAGPRFTNGNSSIKKLNIDRNLKIDLFSSPAKPADAADASPLRKPTKRVSFEANKAQSATEDGSPVDKAGATQQRLNGEASGSGAAKPRALDAGAEMQQVSGKELAVVPEEGTPTQSGGKESSSTSKLGSYWMSPSKEQILKMNRVQRAQVPDFTVGREKVGQIRFKVPVDLSHIDLDRLFDHTVVLTPRSATVYPDTSKKPPMGKGLNVPSEISLEQSGPRANIKNGAGQARRLLDKHVARLKAIENTTFVSFTPETGVWVFTVEHFTTYGLDDDDEDEDEEMTSAVEPSENKAVATPKAPAVQESPQIDPDDTFDFRRKRRAPPGAFGFSNAISSDEEDEEEDGGDNNQQSFLSKRSAGPPSSASAMQVDADTNEGYDLAEAAAEGEADFEDRQAVEQSIEPAFDGAIAHYNETPGGVMRARLRALKEFNAPEALEVAGGDDWMDMLQRTVSPKKRNRADLKTQQDVADEPLGEIGVPNTQLPARGRGAIDDRGFATSMDLMKSLFGSAPPQRPVKSAMSTLIPTSGFKQPYKGLSNANHESAQDMSTQDKAFHDNLRPSWGPDGTLVVAGAPKMLGNTARRAVTKEGLMSMNQLNIVSETRDVRFAKFSTEFSAKALNNQMGLSNIRLVKGVPSVSIDGQPSLLGFFHGLDHQNPASAHEKSVWELMSILFDQKPALPHQTAQEQNISRKAALSAFWQGLIEESTARGVGLARSPEDKAVASLGGHHVADACKHLLAGKDFRLATLVSLIGTDDRIKKDMRDQVREWRETNAFSEFAEPIRAIYELLSGNVCGVAGKKGALEDRMESFVISERFGMDWKQAFGLRLWYGMSTRDGIAAAVNLFEEDVEQEKEQRPQPWFVEQGVEPLWTDPDLAKREDLLWGLLKLSASNSASVTDVLRPENSQLSPLDFRLSWQLGRALLTTGKVSFGGDADDQCDAATLALAEQLTKESHWLEAVFVYLHLTNAAQRVKIIQEHLSRHAGDIGAETSDSFTTLTQSYKIPSAWVWQAKALYMRSIKKDAGAEVDCLLRAGAYAQAHQTFVTLVAPRAIIERDYEGLEAILARFSGQQKAVKDWNLGGGIYTKYLQLVKEVSKPGHAKPAVALLDGLMAGLTAMHDQMGSEDIMQIAATADMADLVAKTVVEMARSGEMQLSNVLQLPLAEDGYLKYSNDLAFAYYRDVMVGRG